jgi:DNA-binding MarR family transcriptional regulator
VSAVAAHERAEELLDEIGELYAIVLRIARNVHEGDEPMTASQRLALIEVSNAGAMRLRQLAQRMDTTPATATRAVDALEDWGFVVRKPDTEDKRGVFVVPTKRGLRWSQKRRAALLEVLEAIPDASTPARLLSDLARLNEALRNESGHSEVARGALLAP